MSDDVKDIDKQINELEKRKNQLVEAKKKDKYVDTETGKIKKILKSIFDSNGGIEEYHVCEDVSEFYSQLRKLISRNYPTFADRKWEIDSFIEDFIKEQQSDYDNQVKNQKVFIKSLEELRKKFKAK